MKKYEISGVYSGDDLRTISAERFLEMYGTEIKEPATYKVGDRFMDNKTGLLYHLILIDAGDPIRFGSRIGVLRDDECRVTRSFQSRSLTEIPESAVNYHSEDGITKIEDDE